MSIPFGFYQGNRSEYLAIPALSKLGFTIPVPRQEDHFGVDFIVHLAKMIDNIITPTGKSFGIQIKSDKSPLIFEKKNDIDCLYSSSLPLFLGVVSRKDLTLTLYNTLNRLIFFWGPNSRQPFRLTCNATNVGIRPVDFYQREADTGKPILEINIGEPELASERLKEIENLQSTMESWINLETENLSLKEQHIPLLFWPTDYSQNEPLPNSLERYSYTKFAGPDSLPNICKATEKALTSLSFYLRRLRDDSNRNRLISLMDNTCTKVESLKKDCEILREKWG
jgi:hypothetical protein